MAETSTSAADNAACQINGTTGVLLSGSCYAVFPGSVVQSKTTWSAGVASWFKANGHCRLIGAQLASLCAALTDANTTAALVHYLADHASPTEPFWVGLTRNPWVWVEDYDEGRSASEVQFRHHADMKI